MLGITACQWEQEPIYATSIFLSEPFLAPRMRLLMQSTMHFSTQCILTWCTRRVLEVRILGGDHHGQTAFIPCITLQPPEAMIGFVLNRRQIPVRLAFAMTINKSQGQSVKNIGINLHTPVFTHGQLYVVLSRCTSKSRVKILFPSTSENTTTTNIVYPEVRL